MDRVPDWLAGLDDDDVHFLRRFLLCSGSLKELAEGYGVSYPTLRARLDRLIAKVKAAEEPGARDELERRLRVLVADGKVTAALARELLAAHRASVEKQEK